MEPLETWIPKRIESLCKKKRLSYYRLSELSQVSRGSLSQIMKGRTLPSLTTLRNLCQGLEMTEAEFFAEHYIAPVTVHDKRILQAFHNLSKQEQDSLLGVLERADRGW